MMRAMTESNKPTFKVVLCGEYGVGKSSLFRRFVYDTFVESDDRRSTLGFDHYERFMPVDGDTVKLSLWDTGGLERIASVTSSYFKHADAALLVFGYDALESFNALSHHLLEVLASAEHCKLFLCGNKADVRHLGVGPSQADVDAFVRENRISQADNLFTDVFAVSCKTNQSVHPMFVTVATALGRLARPAPQSLDHFRLRSISQESQAAKQRCCNGS